MKAKIYLVISLLLLMAACSDETKQQAKETMDSATETGKQVYSEAKEKVDEISAGISDKSKELVGEEQQKSSE
ncbi:MAG: hypothetical protein GY807_12040 [Gammaproteobacteria bacterium]|nr:hypothetical protein [Gammaproteobacteria bacterium]